MGILFVIVWLLVGVAPWFWVNQDTKLRAVDWIMLPVCALSGPISPITALIAGVL